MQLSLSFLSKYIAAILYAWRAHTHTHTHASRKCNLTFLNPPMSLVPRCSSMSVDARRCPSMSLDVPRCSSMLLDVPQCFLMLQTLAKHVKRANATIYARKERGPSNAGSTTRGTTNADFDYRETFHHDLANQLTH